MPLVEFPLHHVRRCLPDCLVRWSLLGLQRTRCSLTIRCRVLQTCQAKTMAEQMPAKVLYLHHVLPSAMQRPAKQITADTHPVKFNGSHRKAALPLHTQHAAVAGQLQTGDQLLAWLSLVQATHLALG